MELQNNNTQHARETARFLEFEDELEIDYRNLCLRVPDDPILQNTFTPTALG